MTFELFVFIVLAALALASAVLMITRRNPVMSVLYLVVNFFCLAVLYLMLQAQFIAIIQILVYAGAIMVLFLFVIMLLNLGNEEKLAEKKDYRKIIAVLFATGAGAMIFTAVFLPAGGARTRMAEQSASLGTVEGIGRSLFRQYLFPFEITSLLLLAAMVGVLILAKKKFR